MSKGSLPGEPFTLAHFLGWAEKLVLDTGKPWVVEPFFAKFVDDLFTLREPENWFILPEGNAKTTSVAGLVLYHLEFKSEAWVPWAAASRDQAEIGYRQAAGFVRRSPSLKGRFLLYDGYRKIVFGTKEEVKEDDTLAPKMQIFAADQGTGDGVIPTLAVDDEPHRQKDMGLYRTWSGKLDKRKGQLLAISTAGEPGSEFENTRELIRQSARVVESAPGFLRLRGPGIVMHEYAVPEGGDVEDMAVVKTANPFSGITVDTLRAKRARPTMTLDHWKRFTCNLPTRGESAAITEAEWHAAATIEEIPAGEGIWAGFDAGWKWDTTAIVPLWMRDVEFRLFGPAVVLTPPRDGNSLSPDDVKRAFLDLHARNPIHTVVMDMHRAEEIAAWIQSELGAMVVDRSQSNVAAATDYEKFMEALRNGWLRHSGDVDFTRHALNAVAHLLPDKKAKFERPQHSRNAPEQGRRVIDALIAGAMVHAVAAAEYEAPSGWGVAA